MSDFFYKEKMGPVFSPVISVKRDSVSPTVISAIDNLLSPSGNMFTRAETVKKLMGIEKMSLEQTAQALSLKMSDVADKLRLLEFTPQERCAILEYGFSESSALAFLSLDKFSRLYAMEFCRKNGYSGEQVKGYVEGIVAGAASRKREFGNKTESVRKAVVNDMGFLLNSIENALKLARKAGFEVENSNSEKKDCYDIHIRVKKHKKDPK